MPCCVNVGAQVETNPWGVAKFGTMLQIAKADRGCHGSVAEENLLSTKRLHIAEG